MLIAYKAAKKTQSPFKKLFSLDYIGWLIAFIAIILLVARNLIIEYLSRFFKWIVNGVYRQVAGFRPFWTIALRCYRKALKRNYEELKIPFLPGRPLQMKDVYVPLRVPDPERTNT